jgi:hypothetical protein
MMESAANGGGTNTMEASAPVAATASLTVLKIGLPQRESRRPFQV